MPTVPTAKPYRIVHLPANSAWCLQATEGQIVALLLKQFRADAVELRASINRLNRHTFATETYIRDCDREVTRTACRVRISEYREILDVINALST